MLVCLRRCQQLSGEKSYIELWILATFYTANILLLQGAKLKIHGRFPPPPPSGIYNNIFILFPWPGSPKEHNVFLLSNLESSSPKFARAGSPRPRCPGKEGQIWPQAREDYERNLMSLTKLPFLVNIPNIGVLIHPIYTNRIKNKDKK